MSKHKTIKEQYVYYNYLLLFGNLFTTLIITIAEIDVYLLF